jgi:hypothetical protein
MAKNAKKDSELKIINAPQWLVPLVLALRPSNEEALQSPLPYR